MENSAPTSVPANTCVVPAGQLMGCYGLIVIPFSRESLGDFLPVPRRVALGLSPGMEADMKHHDYGAITSKS